MRTLVSCHGLWQTARLLLALLTSCVVVSAPGPAAAADGCQVFGDPGATPPVVAVQDVIGTYRRMPVQNGYHTGSLALAPGSTGMLVWTNAAGVSWALAPDLARQRLLTGADNPYQSSGIQDFTLAFQGNERGGFRFGNEVYELDGALADQGERGAANAPQVVVADTKIAQPPIGLLEAGLTQAQHQVAHHLARLRRDDLIGYVVDIGQVHILVVGHQGRIEPGE